MRIAIVNDMQFATIAIGRVIEGEEDYTVAWTASSGEEAVAKCALDTPDLLLMDMVMEPMDGVEATKIIMRDSPCPILIVTATVEANSGMVFQAMGQGALDVVATPSLADSAGQKLMLLKIRRLRSLLSIHPARSPASLLSQPRKIQPASALIAIGASAGGPAALESLLSQLSPSLPAGVIIVQHIDGCFTGQLADWLASASGFPVRVAHEADSISHGEALLANGDRHLVFKSAKSLGYVTEKKNNNYVPSVDMLFRSAAKFWPGRLCGVLLTGMGKDGAVGLKMIRQTGALTIAQDRMSSALYGMPRAAMEIEAACEILPLDRIAARLNKWIQVPETYDSKR